MSIRVLIAHGNTQRLKNAVSELHAAGFEVSATPDGGDAFARFFEERPDIVICSMQLPSLAGANIARMVHSQSPDTTVVLLTDGDSEPAPEGVITLPDPLTLPELREALPQFAFDTLEPPAPVADTTPSTPVKVFVQAVLKRYQRDNRALSVLDEHGISRMAAVAENRSFETGALVIRQGDEGDGFYLVVEGQVRVTLAEKGNKEVARIEAGGFFGEMSLLSDQKRSASVWTVGPSTLLWFDKQKFMPLLHDYPTMREVLSGVALKRTEENLWRVLFDDEEVQRSLAQLDLNGPQQTEVDIDIDEGELAPDPATTPIAKARESVTPPSRPSFGLGLAIGFVGGLLVMWVARPRPEPVIVSQHVAPAAPAVVKVDTPKDEAVVPHEPPARVDPPAVAAKPESAKPEAVTEEAAKPEPQKPITSGPRDDLLAAAKNDNWRGVLTQAKKLKAAGAAIDPEVAFAIAEGQRQAGSADAALAAYLDFIKTYPADGRTDDSQFWAAELYRQQGKTELAQALYAQVAATAGSNFKKSAEKHLK